MNRLIVSALVLGVTLSVPVSSLLAGGPTQTRTQAQTQSQSGDCVCDGPNSDADCPQNSHQNQSGNAQQGTVPGGLQYLFQLMLQFFGGGE